MKATAAYVAKIELILLRHLEQEARKQLVRIGTSLADIIARVPACEAVDIDLHVEHVARYVSAYMLELCIVAYTARTTNENLAFILRIEVNEYIALQQLGRESLGTGKTSLLIDSEEAVHRTMLHLLIGKDSHGSSHTYTIVGSESRTLRFEPLAVNPWFYGILCKIVLNVGTLVAHHIHVTLQDNGLAVLITRSRGFLYKHIAYTVGYRLVAKTLAELLKKR